MTHVLLERHPKGFGKVWGGVSPSLNVVRNALLRLWGVWGRLLKRVWDFINPMQNLKKAWDNVTGAIEYVIGPTDEINAAWSSVTDGVEDVISWFRELEVTWEDVGAFIGSVAAGVAGAFSLAFATVVNTIAWAIDKAMWLADGFGWLRDQVLDIGADIARWFIKDFPKHIASFFSWIGGAFEAVWDFFVGIGDRFMGFIKWIGEGIASFFSPIIEFFQGLARGIREVFMKIRDVAINILRQIPDRLLPSNLESIKRLPLSSEIDEEDEFGVTPVLRLPEVSPLAAGRAQAEGERQGQSALLAKLDALNERLERQNERPITVQVQVDEDTLAETTARANENQQARSYVPVGQL